MIILHEFIFHLKQSLPALQRENTFIVLLMIHPLNRERPTKLIVYMTWALSFPDISPVFHFSLSLKIILETTHKEHAHYPEGSKRTSVFSLPVVKLFWEVISDKLPVICLFNLHNRRWKI